MIAQNRAGAGGIFTASAVFTNGSYLIVLRFAVPDVAGDFTTQGYNFIGVADGSSGFVNGLNGDRIGSSATPLNPLLGQLQDNGGPTFTHALLPGSPAIDQGNSLGLNRDQRGRRRPIDLASVLNAPGGDGSDIGAYELGARGHRGLKDDEPD